MKKVLIIMTAVALLSSCSKSDDNFVAVPKPQAVQQVLPSRHITLDMLDVHLYKMQSTKTSQYQEGGYRYEWNINNEQYTLLFQVDVDTNDVVKNITGRYNGKSFIMYNGGINFCGGAQGVQFNYTIYK